LRRIGEAAIGCNSRISLLGAMKTPGSNGQTEFPMTSFKEREKAEEAKFAHDAELEFKVNARRVKLLGLWVAEQLGMTGEIAEAYARDLVQVDFTEPGQEDVFGKVWADIQAKEAKISEHQVRREMERLHGVAAEQIQAEAVRG
tara:strand:- start:154 stop:585 length:432 start_codon:yes stop_codon:yes gene_type:complete